MIPICFSAEKRAAKFTVKQVSEQSCATQEKAVFPSTCYSGGAVERGDAGPVAKKSSKNVLRDDITRLCLF